VPLTSSEVSTADVATVPLAGVGTLLALPGTVSTSQRTVLAGTGESALRKVVSTAKGSTADLGLLDGQLKVAVIDAPTLTATAGVDCGPGSDDSDGTA
jgi:hypothetical protein